MRLFLTLPVLALWATPALAQYVGNCNAYYTSGCNANRGYQGVGLSHHAFVVIIKEAQAQNG
jgi:hypothetical protein